MDPSSTNIPLVELLINKTKAEIVQIFRDIQQLGNRVKREYGSSLCVFVCCIGFMLEENSNSDQLKALGAPLEVKNYQHDYHTTQQGELVCYP